MITANSTQQDTQTHQDWWASLKHGGLLIAPAKVSEFFVAGSLSPLPRYIEERLRGNVELLKDGNDSHLSTFLDTVLQEVLGLTGDWQKGSQVDRTWSYPAITREVIRPRRVWQGAHGEVLPVFVADGQESGGKVTRLGIGRGKRVVSRVVEWLRKANQKIALLTNGYQWRLIHAGADYEAWCEWDIAFWFEEGQLGAQVTALRLLLGRQALETERTDVPSPLLGAIAASRQGQAELSEVLGERVRQAVELLIRESSESLSNLMATSEGIESRNVYIAATRIVMRCVVILFAEARDLLPRDNPIYHSAYGLQGLREQLDRRAGGRAAERLRQGVSAWPRLLALFKLVYEGCAHEALPVPQYGGGLFEPGDRMSTDPVLQALSAFEDSVHTPSDAVVYRILELLCRSKIKVRQGRRSTWVEAPVDFSDLSSEYIGILYEGLLDFELRRTADDDPMVFLNLGDQPALPLTRLEGMDDKALASLVEKLKQKAKPSSAEDDSSEEDEDEDEEGSEVEEEETEAEADSEDEDSESDDDDSEDDQADLIQDLRDRAQQWAVRAVKAGKLVAKPRSKKAEALAEYEQQVGKMAARLIARVILPGEWFLVRWGGTRKGSGTFYTRPQLAVPTVQRTLLPLAYNPPTKSGDEPDRMAPAAQWTPKSPAEILALKVCDPACGSASFLIASLRFLVDALWSSLFEHGWLIQDGDQIREGIPKDAQPEWFVECVKNLPLAVEKAEEYSKPRLKRYVVERCIYGVDINPLAVELGRLALWVETMDRSLAFSFLDHKVKCGNSLVGCWFDQFQDYPIMAWEREAGDASHKGVHFAQKAWTKEIKRLRNEVVRDELKELLTGVQLSIFEDRLIQSPEQTHDEVKETVEQIHAAVLDPDRQAMEYETSIQQKEALKQLRWAFDCWCAVWFWQGNDLELAPMPLQFVDPSPEVYGAVERLAQEYQFFHWELEFPDVFSGTGTGFDGIVGNPPWETLQPNSKEFFSDIDPLYRTYGKQEALEYQKSYFETDTSIEESWLRYCANFKALANWSKFASYAFGDDEAAGSTFSLSRKKKEAEYLQKTWKSKRSTHKGYSDPNHPFRYQGEGKPYTYKLFTELAYALLRNGGRFSLIIPSGIYTDKGSADLRSLFLNCCEWTHLYAFQNERFVFSNIHHSFKMVVLSVNKDGYTESISTRFRLGPGDSPEAQELETDVLNDSKYLSVPATQIKRFSPNTGALLEVRTEKDLKILEKMYSNGVLLGDRTPQGWGIQYRQGDFNMTSDSKLFPPRPKWEEKCYRPDEYGHWLKGNWQPYNGEPSILKRPEGLILSVDGKEAIRVDEVEDVALPLYQGIMIGQLESNRAQWISGSGNRAVWEKDLPPGSPFEPQFLISKKSVEENCPDALRSRYLMRNVARTTDTRTMIGSPAKGFPAGHSLASLSMDINSTFGVWEIGNVLSSFTFDWGFRQRLGGTNLSWAFLEEMPICRKQNLQPEVAVLGLSLSAIGLSFAEQWRTLKSHKLTNFTWQALWAVTTHERSRIIAILNSIVANLYGLEDDDFYWIFRDCDYSIQQVNNGAINRNFDPKGFWRVDKEKDPELRHTVLSLIAFHDLKKIGLDAFLNLNDGEGWMLPKTLRLADYDLGHDDRAKEHQPVAARLGDRFLPWQLEGTPEDSWAECERHAENLKRLLEHSPHPLTPSPTRGEEEQDPAPLSRSGRGAGGEGKFTHPKQLNLIEEETQQLGLFDTLEQ